MKVFYIIPTLLCLSIMASAQRNISNIHFKVIKKHFVKENVDKAGKPQWNDPRVLTLEGRKQIVAEAWEKVISYLSKCSGDVAIYSLLCIQKRGKNDDWCNCSDYTKCIEGKRVFMTDIDNNPSWYVKTRVCVQYVQVPTTNDVYAINYLDGNHDKQVLENKKVPEQYRPQSIMAEQEYFFSKIEIYPDIFEQGAKGGFYMESEKDSEEGPWAKNPVEAVSFVLLHELGHLEYYISQEKESSYLKRLHLLNRHEKLSSEAEEKFCDKFASSVWRCKRK